ncbi:hypothetical protein BSLG_008213 [Batrachochytrium salamandrivorans]|nr:hypothetical protein BSLG_008213 [Batrachochytrium salamandrivorans]
MSESADNGLQLYKRQPLPPLTKDGEPSQLDDEAGVKCRVFGKLAKGVGLFKASRFATAFQKMKLPGHRRRPKSSNQEEQSADVDELKTENSDSDTSLTSKTNSRPEVQRPIIDISKANLKPVVQRPKPQHMPESPSYQFQLRKMAHGGSKDQVSTNKNTDQETDAQESSTSYQQKSPEVKIPPAVLARPDMKLV